MEVRDKMDSTKICKLLFEASIQAGVVALAMQKGITNEGKKVERLAHEDAHHLAMRQAKTKVDVMVQDMLLTALRGYRDVLTLDVEEESQQVTLFSNAKAEYSLIIDPIDGTLDYLNQKDTYSICCAVIFENDIEACVVYFPARDILYCYEPKGKARYFKQAHLCLWEDGETIPRYHGKPNLVYKNDRVDQTMIARFEKAGYRVFDDRTCNCPEALIHCIKEEALCYLCDTRNLRDILMGAILSKCEHGALLDEHGETIAWPLKGRLPFGIFTRFPEEISKILK